MKFYKLVLISLLFGISTSFSQSLPGSYFVKITGGTFTMGESEDDYKGPPNSYDATLHSVTLSDFYIGMTEITNEQYKDFLNSAYEDGLLTVAVETSKGPDEGFELVYGSDSAPDEYKGIAIINLSGTRVMKNHIDDGDGDPFTGEIQPENPLNLCYIGFDEARADGEKFYIKDPQSNDDFDWRALTDYYNYTSEPYELDTSVLLNDYDNWPELQDFPNNMPTHSDVKSWPASFIRWYGAKAFAMYYNVDLPTEAQWEYAARGGADFEFATADGDVAGNGTSANWNWKHDEPALHHVYHVELNNPNPYGIYNMAGNVWEWCEDWYSVDFYLNDATDPVCTDATSNKKVRRGGSWNYHETTLKAAARAKDEKFKGNDHFGFRVVSNSEITSLNEEGEQLPQKFILHQNYPNPFNPITKIKYTVGSVMSQSSRRDKHINLSYETQHISLKVFNSLGQEIATLVNKEQTPGEYVIDFDGTEFSSGIYFYKLNYGDKAISKKMLLVK